MRKLKPKKAEIIYAASRLCYLVSLHLNHNIELCLYAMSVLLFVLRWVALCSQKVQRHEWLLFKPSMDILMTLHLPKVEVWNEKQ